MEQAGILRDDENVELIDGEIITMAAKSPRHEDMRALLAEHFSDSRPKDVRIAQEPAFRLSNHHEPEPGIILFPRPLVPSKVRGNSVMLVVEVAVTSLSSDMTIKAPIYAAHGVREYWVVDARRLVVHVHRDPGPDGYASIREVPPGERIEPLLVPSVGLALTDFGLEPMLGEDEIDGTA